MDTAKVRLQIQGGKGGVIKYNGLLDCIRKSAAEEGPLALFSGLNAGIQRQMVFASIRIGAYDSVSLYKMGHMVMLRCLLNKIDG